jgi:hypothetical protein
VRKRGQQVAGVAIAVLVIAAGGARRSLVQDRNSGEREQARAYEPCLQEELGPYWSQRPQDVPNRIMNTALYQCERLWKMPDTARRDEPRWRP